MSEKPVFGYWNIRGLGHPIRYLLAYLGVDYKEKRYDISTQREEWLADKTSLNLDFPNIPYLLDGDNTVTESRVIMKYLCRTRKPEMLGKTVLEQTQVDTIDNVIYDLFYVSLVPVIYKYTDELNKEFKETTAPLKLGYLNKFLDGKKWVIGDDLTYVDFFVYEVLRDLVVYDAKILDNFANLQAYVTRFENIPEIKKYMESPSFIKTPIFAPFAVIKI